jgi:hypothetical protein
MFKVICDFTGVLQFRHPNELGGILMEVSSDGIIPHRVFSILLTLFLSSQVAKLFSGLKPAFDAYAVGTGAERPAYAVFDPFTEMVGARMMELFSEAIPMAVLQVRGREERSTNVVNTH